MKIIAAQLEDTDQIMLIIEQAKHIMRKNGNQTQWINGYPSKEIIETDIRNQHAFVCLENTEIVGYFCFIEGNDPDPNYKVIEGGAWLNNAPYGVIHRLASSGTAKGIARKAFGFAFNQISNVRVDTNHDNIPMQNFLKNSGFTYCGVIYVSDGTPRDAFQKTLP
ncbi:GNAT family N-acetyltransferase [Pedobacter cryoconitis]|uniref:RimJ/RimL family protein N-acetyltransferase n=1 Tax=Pedobacter cryoconitis TaxID=188932 RepID=A0A7X0MJP9_9SPHI|nr:GNAT family protein [Pedobacter cryoconitis]MBB6499850.1 RimJ/RimL family protein N-acetyltransferase [Pedobacter cryoconitis]